MSFFRTSGAPNIQPMPGAASTVLVANGLVTVTAGAIAKSAATDSVSMGICLETRATTDGDYANARDVLVDLVGENDILLCDNVVGTLTVAMKGQYFKLSSTTGISADAATATDTPGAGLILLCTGFVSATAGYFILSGSKTSRPAA